MRHIIDTLERAPSSVLSACVPPLPPRKMMLPIMLTTSFVDHYEEYVSQTRAELSAQRPAAHAFAVTAPLHSYVGAHRLRNISLHSFTS
mmetsp:Transcript_28811/g.88336  ORF Transcript_28811/g.88336 Transcript_28811/m.88336 type:complete len:89 (-) Transcript_28811:559-825(-)